MKQKLKQKLRQLYYSEKPLKIEWGVAILIGLVMLICFSYVDLKSLTIWSTNIWDSLFLKGDIRQYYSYTADNIYKVPHQYVSGTLYSLVVWGVWNLPIWAIQTFFNYPIMDSSVLMTWSHMFLYAATVLTLVITYKVVLLLTADKNKAIWASFLSGTFGYTYIGVGYSGQNDILICLLGISAIYCLFKEKKILFYILAGFAISVKYYFLLPYLAILLVTEKNILKIGLKVFIGLLPTIIYKIICSPWPYYYESEALNQNTTNLFETMFSNTSGVLMGFGIPLFVISISAILIMAYLTSNKTREEKNVNVIYYATASMLALFVTVTPGFYRMILLMPFLFILFMINKKIFKINILLELLMTVSSIIINSMCEIFLFATQYSMDKTIFSKLLGNKISYYSTNQIFQTLVKSDDNNNVVTNIVTKTGEIVTKNNTDMYSVLGRTFVGLFIISIIAMLIINHPKFNKEELAKDNENCPRWIIWIRTVLLVPIIILMIYHALI